MVQQEKVNCQIYKADKLLESISNIMWKNKFLSFEMKTNESRVKHLVMYTAGQD